jgi:hypothetical protein
MNPLARVLFAVLFAMLALLVVDPVYPLALMFWQQTVPISSWLVMPLSRVCSPMTAGVLAVGISAAFIASCWAYGLYTWVRPRKRT